VCSIENMRDRLRKTAFAKFLRPPQSVTNKWPPERVEKLRQFRQIDCLSFTQIGERMGISRSAVSGAVWRHLQERAA
jgi:predicted DNA-binding protein (UPF0251 family)